MALDVLGMIDKATEKASAPKASRKPVFLYLAESQKALVRPMFNLTEALVLAKHNKWSENRDYRVNALCAAEVGKACEHCANAKELEDKKLNASSVLFLPVYVYNVINVKTGERVVYTEKDEHDKDVEKPVSGFRVLELPFFGRAFSILQALRAHIRDEDGHDIRVCDFSIEQLGAGQNKSFIVKEKPPQAIHPKIAAACPPLEKFREALLAACPPLVVTESVGSVQSVAQSNQVEDDDIPEF